jgi:hypothetical protein
MQLQDVLLRIARGLEYVDAHTTNQKTQRGKPHVLYHLGLPALHEDDTRSELIDWWQSTYPGDFLPGTGIEVRRPYPNIPGSACDMVFSTSTYAGPAPEWAVELKVVRFIGDNGKKNPYGTGKFLSPYKMETSLTTDLVRLHNSTIAPRKAVVGWAFQHSFRTCDDALKRHPAESVRIGHMREACHSNDPHQGVIDVRDLLSLVDYSVKFHGVATTVQTEPFVAWRSPTGGEGLVFGWKV